MRCRTETLHVQYSLSASNPTGQNHKNHTSAVRSGSLHHCVNREDVSCSGDKAQRKIYTAAAFPANGQTAAAFTRRLLLLLSRPIDTEQHLPANRVFFRPLRGHHRNTPAPALPLGGKIAYSVLFRDTRLRHTRSCLVSWARRCV